MHATAPYSYSDDWVSLVKWRQSVGVSGTTVWRWEKAGRLTVARVGGRKYINKREASAWFERAQNNA